MKEEVVRSPSVGPIRTDELKAGMTVSPSNAAQYDKYFRGEPAKVESTTSGDTSWGLVTINFRRKDETLFIFPSEAGNMWLLVANDTPQS